MLGTGEKLQCGCEEQVVVSVDDAKVCDGDEVECMARMGTELRREV